MDKGEGEVSPGRELRRKYAAVFKEAWSQRHAARGRPVFRAVEADFLPAALAVVERPTPVAPRVALWSLVSMVFIALLWSILGRIDVVVVAGGRALAAGRTHPVQSLENQIVRRVLVREGQVVGQDETLVEADRIAAEADLQRYKNEVQSAASSLAAFAALLERLAGQTEAQPQPPSADMPLDEAKARQIVLTKWIDHISRLARARQELRRRESEEGVAQTTLANAQSRLELRTKLASDYRAMMTAGAAAQHAWIERQIALDDLYRDIAQAKAQLKLAAEATAVASTEIEIVIAEARASWSDKLNDARRELEVGRAETARTMSRIANSYLRAPVAGRIQQLGALAPGQVIAAGQPFAAVVPDMPVEEVEIQVENKDIGFVKVGQDVAIKVSAYDYTRFGTLPGKVTYISHDAVSDDKGVLRFIARASLASSAFVLSDGAYSISPGMEVSADVKVGRRQIITYFLSPILKTVSEAIRER